MVIHCPSCHGPIRLVDLMPGRFAPTCPNCRKPFSLTIPTGEVVQPVIEPATDAPAEGTEPSLEAIPTTFEADSTVPLRGRLPRGTPRFLGGHLVLKLLGRGPRGKSLLARPLSLGGRVVLKVVSADRGRDALFVECHLREALATAQLSSPHLIPIVDLGRDGSNYFVAMEHVPGASLAEEIARRGKVEPTVAVAWILQAARGLAEAHSQGLWHRDLKPENLRLTPDGLVVVDDLGLETTPSLVAAENARERASSKAPRGKLRLGDENAPGSGPALRHVAVGSPTHMAPEQADDALMIDGRADVYSLGCTFHHLVTGRPPFAGATAVELIERHRAGGMIPPREVSPEVSPALNDVIRTMTRRSPEERYPSMSAVVDALEETLGPKRDAATPDENRYREAINHAIELLGNAPATRLRNRVLMAVGGSWLALVLLLVATRAFQPLLVVGGFGLLTAGMLASASRSLRPLGLADPIRELILGDGVRSWTRVGLAMLAFLAIIVQIGLLGPVVFMTACAGGLVAAFDYWIDRPWLADLNDAAASVRDPLRRLRRAGADERQLRDAFIAAGGPGWETPFAAVFGGRALAAERARAVGDPTFPGVASRFPWTSQLERVLAGLARAKREARLYRLFREVEEARLEAEGLNLMTARRVSERVARALIASAAEWREERLALRGATGSDGPSIVQRLREVVVDPERMLEARDDGRGPFSRKVEHLASRVLGRLPRLIVAVLLLAAFAFWMHHHEVVTADQVAEAASRIGRAARTAAETADPNALREIDIDISVDPDKLARPLGDEWVPGPLRAIPAANAGAAGLLLLVSLAFRSRGIGLAAWLAALVTFLVPAVDFGTAWLAPGISAPIRAMLGGAIVLALGILLARR